MIGKETTIRSAVPDDAERLLEIYSYYVLNTAVSFEYDVPSADEFRHRIETTLKKYPYLVIETGGRITGYAYAGPFKARAAYCHSCEVSIYLEHGTERHGNGKKLYAALENELKGLGILNMYACIGIPETDDEYLTRNSELYHSHLGFTKVGEFRNCAYKFGRWYSMIWMEKIIGDHSAFGQ